MIQLNKDGTRGFIFKCLSTLSKGACKGQHVEVGHGPFDGKHPGGQTGGRAEDGHGCEEEGVFPDQIGGPGAVRVVYRDHGEVTSGVVFSMKPREREEMRKLGGGGGGGVTSLEG